MLPGAQKLLTQTAVFKLNGGLGTSMGLEKAKSLLEVKNGKTFLDLIAEQIKYTRKQFGSKARALLCCLLHSLAYHAKAGKLHGTQKGLREHPSAAAALPLCTVFTPNLTRRSASC